MDSASNVERWCKSSRVGNCFAAGQGSLLFSRSVVEHHVRNPTAIQSGDGVLNLHRNSYAREKKLVLPCDFPDKNWGVKAACEDRLAQSQMFLQLPEEVLKTMDHFVVSMTALRKEVFGQKMDGQHGRK